MTLKKITTTLLLVALMSGFAGTSKGSPPDPPPLASAEARQVSHVVSWVTVLTLEALDVMASFRAPDRGHAFLMQGIRVGVVEGATFGLKKLIPSARPCAPTHDCGSDGEMSGFPSGHMALACSTLGGPSLTISIPLMGATAAGRWLAWRHDVGQLVGGCFIGAVAGKAIR